MIWGQYDDFEIWCAQKWDFAVWCAQKWDFAKTCCARPQKCVMCTFCRNRTVFHYLAMIWGQYDDFADLVCGKSEILSKLAPHGPKRSFCTLFVEIAHCLPDLAMISGQYDDFEIWCAAKVGFCQTLLCTFRPKRAYCTLFVDNRTIFHDLAMICGQYDDFEICRTQKVRFLPKLALHTAPKRALYVQILIEIAHCFTNLAMIWGQYDDFEVWCAQKWDFAKTCSARPQTCVLFTFHRNCSVFTIWRWFEASTTILRSGVHKTWNFTKSCSEWSETSALSTLSEYLLSCNDLATDTRQVRRFWGVVCSKVRFCQKLLRTAPNVRFVHFL